MISLWSAVFGNPIFTVFTVAVLVCGFFRGGWLKYAAIAFAASWVLGGLSYTAYSPSLGLRAVGIPLASSDIWALTDALFGLLCIALGWREFSGWMLWAIALLQEIMHILYWHLGAWDKATYYGALDNSWLVMVAVFLVAGGPSVVDYLRFHLGAGGGFYGSRSPAQATAKLQKKR